MDLSGAIETIRPSVVQIAVKSPQKYHPSISVVGTGFWVNHRGLALTAKHVTEGARTLISNSPGTQLLIGRAMPNVSTPGITLRASFDYLQADIIEEDPQHDLALLQSSPNPFEAGPKIVIKTPDPETDVYLPLSLATLARTDARDGEWIAVSGYPLQEPALVTTSGGIASAFSTDIKEIQSPGAPPGFTVPAISDSYLADVSVNPGNSGGPVYRITDGEVIGVCVAFRIGQGSTGPSMFQYNSGLSVIVPIKYGLKLIAKHAS
jgi:S1-C subfamily serine protease